MNVFANTVVSLTFKLFDARDTLIEEAREPITYLHGGYSGIFPRVEEALMHKKVGESVSVRLTLAEDRTAASLVPRMLTVTEVAVPSAETTAKLSV